MKRMGRVDERKCGLIYPALLAGESFSLAGRTQVSPSTVLASGTTINLVYFGQSNAGNTINATASPAHGSAIYNGSIGHRGALFQAVEPLLFSETTDGHSGMYLADALITDAACDKVVVWNSAYGGSYMAQWSPSGGTEGSAGAIVGNLAYRIALTARCIAAADLWDKKTVIILRIGENASAAGASQVEYTASQGGFITELKRSGLLRPGTVLFIDQTTDPREVSGKRNPIRAAQAAAVDSVLIRSGFDCDTLDSSYRYAPDFVHFKANGAAAITAGSKAAIESYIANG